MLLAFVTFANSQAQDNNDFKAFAKREKGLMLKAYANKDIASYRKALNDFHTRFDKLSDKEKANFKWDVAEEYYILACVYALHSDTKNAMDYLEKSEDYDYTELLKDHDLDNLRHDSRFKKYIDKAKNTGSSFQIILQKAPAYNQNEKDNIPAFTYQAPDDPNLKALKTSYNLDSIAGKGNDISQIINLMEWVHYLIPHDGSKGNPKIKNAMSLITECKQNNKTLNCRGLGILLNEVYLAEGFKSRFITCMPKDTTDNDCHVITMVWSNSLNKWLWMDPTFMAYIMDDKGALLSIAEVRERLINNKPLILNPDANRNHETSQTISDYLGYYISKNLYKLECPVNSQYNYETPEDGKQRAYIQLIPGNTKPATSVTKNEHGMATYTRYYTNNPASFWAAPTSDMTPATSRSRANYEQVMEKFKNYYNEQLVDSIVNMFANPAEMKSFFSAKVMEHFNNDYGKMISYKYIGTDDVDGNNDALFKMVFDKSVHMMGISIDPNNKLENFRFQTSSSYIDKLLAKEK